MWDRIPGCSRITAQVDDLRNSIKTYLFISCNFPSSVLGDCSMAICGGVNCILYPEMFVQLSKARMVSPTGQSKAFSADADGYTRGEGCGIVLLKNMKQVSDY